MFPDSCLRPTQDFSLKSLCVYLDKIEVREIEKIQRHDGYVRTFNKFPCSAVFRSWIVKAHHSYLAAKSNGNDWNSGVIVTKACDVFRNRLESQNSFELSGHLPRNKSNMRSNINSQPFLPTVLDCFLNKRMLITAGFFKPVEVNITLWQLPFHVLPLVLYDESLPLQEEYRAKDAFLRRLRQY